MRSRSCNLSIIDECHIDISFYVDAEINGKGMTDNLCTVQTHLSCNYLFLANAEHG